MGDGAGVDGPETEFKPFRAGKSFPPSGIVFRGRPLYGIESNEGTLGIAIGMDELFNKGLFGSGFIACGEVR
jgi:hypothetical protein